jgi:hypothetical protein
MKLLLITFMRNITLFIFLFASEMLRAAVPDEVAAVAGRYAGMAFNGSNMDPVVTVLAFDNQGRFAGTYYVEDEIQEFEGRLSNLIMEGEHTFTLEWTDRFGEGFALFEFNSDYSAFTGYWTTVDAEDQFPWNGRRQ